MPLPFSVPKGGVPGWSPVDLAVPAPAGGLPSLPPVNPAFSLLSFPHPPDPLPGGKGEIFTLFRRGLRPRHPGVKPLAALTVSAVHVPGGGVPSESPTRRKTDRTAFLLAVPAAKERGDRGRWNYPSQARAAFEMVLSPGAGRTGAAWVQPPAGYHSGKVSWQPTGTSPRRARGSPPFPVPPGFSPGDARGEAPCMKKTLVSPFPGGEGGRGDRGQESKPKAG